MKKQELIDKIKKMEAGISNPNITGAVKEKLQASLETAKGQLADMEKSQEPAASSAAEEKKLTKKDFYALADKTYPDLTRNGLNELPQNAYDVTYKQLLQLADGKGLNKKEAKAYVESYIARHIPAGDKTKPAGTPKKEPKKAEEKPKAAENPPTPSAAYSWKKSEDVKNLKPVVLHCQHYSLPVEKAVPVRLKGSGNESIVVTAQPGEHLIFDDKGYLVFVMNKGSFARKCNEGTTVVDHEQTKHLAERAKELEADLKAEKEKAGKLEKQVGELESQLETAIEMQTPEWKKDDEGKSPAKVEEKPTDKAQAPKKRTVCTLAEAETGRRVSRVSKFFLDEAEAWNNSKSTRKILKVMQTKGETQEVIIEVADYRGFATGLATLIGGARKYYRLCIDSFALTPVPAPKAGSYKIVIPPNRMKEVYTTKGAKQYKICLSAYRELLKCSFEGSCTKDQAAKWKTLYNECGDLVAKLDKNPDVLRNFHVEVKKRRKAGESYSDAMSRVAAEIKKESGK